MFGGLIFVKVNILIILYIFCKFALFSPDELSLDASFDADLPSTQSLVSEADGEG